VLKKKNNKKTNKQTKKKKNGRTHDMDLLNKQRCVKKKKLKDEKQ